MAELGFGLMRLPLLDPGDHASVDTDAVGRMADRFLESGGTYFDTAYYYHRGASERAVGECLSSRHPRPSFRLATKMPLKILESEGDHSRIFAEQLERCGVDRFDSYLMHNACRSFMPAVERLGTFGFVRGLRDAGLVGRVGVSVHDDAAHLSGLLDKYDFIDFVQLQVNYLDWEDPRIQSRACCEAAAERGIPVVVMEPLRGGALADPPEAVRSILSEVDPDASPVSWALRFCAGVEGVETVLSGMSDMAQLEENIRVMRDPRPLDGEELEALSKAAEAIRSAIAIPCTGCDYCTESCPMDIPMPDYFSIYNATVVAPAGGLQPQRFYYLNRSQGHGRASDCVGCGRCEAVCPQGLPIRRHLGEVARLFEIP